MPCNLWYGIITIAQEPLSLSLLDLEFFPISLSVAAIQLFTDGWLMM